MSLLFKLKRVMRSGVCIACFYMHARRVGTVNLDAEEHQNKVGNMYPLGGSVSTLLVHIPSKAKMARQ